MSEILNSMSAALEMVSKLRDLNKRIESADFSNALADLSLELAEMKIRLAGLIEENDELKRKLLERNSQKLEFKEFAYFSQEADGPFCPGCYDSSRKVIRLAKESSAFQVFGSHSCPVCGKSYGST